MKFNNVVLETIAEITPPVAFSSTAIEEQLKPLYERLKLPQGRLELMTGIQTRHFWEDTTLPSQGSSYAGTKLFENNPQLNREEIDLVIHSSVCRDRLEPATASYVHRQLNLPAHCQIFDVSNACLGFLNAMVVASGLIESGQIRRALIVSGENGKPLLQKTIDKLLNDKDLTRKSIKPYFANLTIGAGAVAATLCHKDIATKPIAKCIAATIETDSSQNHLCEGDSATGDSLEMQTQSEELLHAGIATAKRCWDRFKEDSGWSEETPEHIVCHQVGKAHRDLLYSSLSLDLKKDISTFETLGNVGSVSLPISFTYGLQRKEIQNDAKVALLGIGSGISSLMMALQTY